MKSPHLTRRHRLILRRNSLNKILTRGYRWERSYRNRLTPKQNVSVPLKKLIPNEANEKLICCVVDLGLQVLDEVIMTRWKVLPRDQCQGEIDFRHK